MFFSVPTCFEDVKLLRSMDGLLNGHTGHRCRSSNSPCEVLICQSNVGSRLPPNWSLVQPFFWVFKLIFYMVAFERVAQSRRNISRQNNKEMQLVVLCLFQSCRGYGGPFTCPCSGAHLLIKCTCWGARVGLLNVLKASRKVCSVSILGLI